MGIQDHANQVNDAYDAHVSMYSKRNPPPEPPKKLTWRDITGELLIIVMLAVMVVASVIVSGSRTIPEFGGGLVGIAAFTMLEGGIIAYAYIRTKRHFDIERRNQVFKFLGAGLIFAFGVSVAANVHAVLKAQGIVFGSAVDLAIAIAVAISAPTLALISGDLLGMETVAAASMKKRRQDEYEKRVKEWRDDLNEEWKRVAPKLGVQQRVQIVRPALPDQDVRPALVSGEVSARTKSGQDSRTKVSAYLSALSESGQSRPSVRTIADELGMGKTTVADILKELDSISLSVTNQA
jgi:hypothetical protein